MSMEEDWRSWRVLQASQEDDCHNHYSYQPLEVPPGTIDPNAASRSPKEGEEEEEGEQNHHSCCAARKEEEVVEPEEEEEEEEEEAAGVDAGTVPISSSSIATEEKEEEPLPVVPIDVQSNVTAMNETVDTVLTHTSTAFQDTDQPAMAAFTTSTTPSYQLLAADLAARQPPLHRYSVPQYAPPFAMDVVVAERATETNPNTTTTRFVPHATARQRVAERFGQVVATRATHDYLPVLLGQAVLDECQHAWYQAVTAEGNAAVERTADHNEDARRMPLTLSVSVTPAQLLQRVQRGRSARVLRALQDAAAFVRHPTEEEEINPYLEPDHATIVQWLQSSKGGGGAKTWTTADVQAIWDRIDLPVIRRDVALMLSQLLLLQPTPLRALPFLASAPRHPLSHVVALAQFLAEPDNDATTRLVLHHATHSDDITEWDGTTFGRTLFTVHVELPDHRRATLAQHVAAQAEQQHQEWQARKQLEAYRQQSRQSGYWALPSWMATVRLPSVVETDFALAQRLATQEKDAELGGGRRKTSRRTEAGIFYGNQSNLTMKQLMDALLRAVSVRPVPTLAGLLQAVPDDSSDPVRRTRTALGRLLYKRHQLSRREVETVTTDAAVWESLQKGPLWRWPTSHDGAEGIVDQAAVEELVAYLRTLQQTELQLRRLVLAQLTEIPIAIVATAGDDRIGSMESMDEVDFENSAGIDWQTEGHPLLHQRIYRPRTVQSDVETTTPCVWWELTGYVPSVASPLSQQDAMAPLEKPAIGRAREPTAVERRMRFRAIVCDRMPGYADSLILTEAQVHAGRKAAELYTRQSAEMEETRDHPFASGAVPEISLIPMAETGDAKPPILGYVVGHDRSWEGNRIWNKILVLPQQGGSSISESFWTTLDVPSEGGGMICSVHGEMYSVQQFDFHSSSKAYQECLSIVRFLHRHPKAGVFQEPVDPIALGIPDYPTIIQHPMDVSTLLYKLERGDYSHIPPTFMKTASPVTRMLNGPFRNDVERIFDNAMLFNPPQDWIHQAASFVKKAVIKKIEQASSSFAAEGRSRKQSSIYVDYDSDVDMYVYESDYDDDKGYSRKRRKRPGAHSNGDRSNRSLPASEDSATLCIERGIRIQKMLSDSLGLRGPLSNLPIVSNAVDFSLPIDWHCRYKPATNDSDTAKSVDQTSSDNISSEELQKSQAELDELLSLHRLNEESEQLGTRRSTRATDNAELDRTKNVANISSFDIEYIWTKRSTDSIPPVNRSQVELLRERLHETYFAKLYHSWGMHLVHDIQDEENATTSVAQYSNGLFPPYLGRVVPAIPFSHMRERINANYVPTQKWEIRESMVLPALRWIIRGLLYSEHLVQIADGTGNLLRETFLSQSETAVILPNHVYFIEDSEKPFDVLDIKEMSRRKKQRNASTVEDSEDEVELSEYEKARAERVARNTQRLQALGLA